MLLLSAEDDMEMTEEERNVMRFQKQRMKDALGDKYALKEEDGGGLTHLGRSLADFEDDMPGAPRIISLRALPPSRVVGVWGLRPSFS